MLLLVLATACVNIVLNFILIPKFGYKGAAYATCASYIVYPFLVHFTTRSRIPWRIPWFAAAKIIMASALMGSAVYPLRFFLWNKIHPVITLVLAFAVALPLYFAFLFLLRGIKTYEIDVLRRQV